MKLSGKEINGDKADPESIQLIDTIDKQWM